MSVQISSKNKIYVYVTLVLIALGTTFGQAADYRIYIGASRVIVEDKANPYADEDMIETEPDGLVTNHAQYRYAPLFALSLYPLSLLPKQLYIFLWLLLNTFLLWKTLILLNDFFPKLLDEKSFLMVSLFSCLASVRIIGANLELGQTTIILVYLCILSLSLAKKGKHLLAGLMLAIGIIIKIMPLVLLTYFVFRKDLKTTAYTIIWTVLMVFLPSLFIGWDYNLFLIQEWYQIITPTSVEYAIEDKTGIYNLSAFIYAFLTEMPDETITGKRNLLSLSYDSAKIITQIARGLFILFTIYFTRWTIFRQVKESKRLLWEFGYLLFIFPLIFPAQNKYSFYFIFPVIFYLVVYLYMESKKQGSIWKVKKSILIPFLLYFVLCNLSSANIVGESIYDLSQYYKIITFGMIALLIAYIQVKPRMFPNTEAYPVHE